MMDTQIKKLAKLIPSDLTNVSKQTMEKIATLNSNNIKVYINVPKTSKAIEHYGIDKFLQINAFTNDIFIRTLHGDGIL